MTGPAELVIAVLPMSPDKSVTHVPGCTARIARLVALRTGFDAMPGVRPSRLQGCMVPRGQLMRLSRQGTVGRDSEDDEANGREVHWIDNPGKRDATPWGEAPLVQVVSYLTNPMRASSMY